MLAACFPHVHVWLRLVAKVIHSPCGLKCLSVTKTVNNNKHNLNGMRINKKVKLIIFKTAKKVFR